MTPRPTDWLWALPLCALLLCTSCASAAECAGDGRDVLTQVHARGALRVAHTNDYRPFSFTGADGAPTGIDVDLATRLAADLGVALRWTDTTWTKLAADLQADRYDIAMTGVSVNAERGAIGCFTAPYFATGKTVLTRCAPHRSFATLAQLDVPSTTIIVNPGGTNERFVRAHLQRARVVVHDDNRTIFRALAAGDADAMITDAVEARLQAQSNPALCLAEPPPLFETVEKAYLIPRDPRWQAWLDVWLEGMKSTGELGTVLHRYLNATASQP